MVVYHDFSFSVACSVIFSQYPNLHNSYVSCFIDSFNCKCDASSVLIESCPEIFHMKSQIPMH